MKEKSKREKKQKGVSIRFLVQRFGAKIHTNEHTKSKIKRTKYSKRSPS